MHAHSHTLTPTLIHSHPFTPTHTHSHTYTHSHPLTHTHTHTHSHTPTPTHTHSHPLTHTHTHSHPLTPARIATSVVASSKVGVALPTVLGHHRYGSTVAGEMGSPVTVPQVSPATVAWKYWERDRRPEVKTLRY